jgi:hypothetical protein
LLQSPTDSTPQDFARVASRGPTGAVALCAISVAIVIGIWIAFYFLAFLPRGLLR